MTSLLQDLVDGLADQLGAPTVLEDHDQQMVAYSAHRQPVDELRRESILRRTAGPEAVGWLRANGIMEARAPLRIPGRPEQGILGRLCVPVRHRGRLLGWLFLLDPAGRLSDADAAAASQAATHIAMLLYEDDLADKLAGRTLAHLLSPSEDLRAAATARIADGGLFPLDAPAVVAVVRPAESDSGRGARDVIAAALRDAARAEPDVQALRVAHADHAVLLVRTRAADDDAAGVAAALAAAAALRHRLGDRPVVAAAGDPQATMAEAHVSYRQARLAARVAAVVPGAQAMARWRDLGVYRILAQLPRAASESALDPRVRSLLCGDDAELLHTLETYLDLGCDAQAAARQLRLHRATLYYRLDKARRVAGIDMRDGNDRLCVHAGLKLARLTGRFPADA